MTIGFSGEAFGNLLVLLTLIGIVFCAIIFYVAHKKGIDVTAQKFQLRVLVGIGSVMIILPLCLSDLSFASKVIGSFLAMFGALVNYFGIDRLQNIIKKKGAN
jgi:uncharacterized membrane protein YidH (DUF202 family)